MPCPVIYSRFMLKPWMRGRYLIAAIVIDQKYKRDFGILAHEREHERQMWRSMRGWNLLMPWRWYVWRYNLDAEYRYRCEVEAYRAQLAMEPNLVMREIHMNDYAVLIACYYGVNYLPSKILEDLKNGARV